MKIQIAPYQVVWDLNKKDGMEENNDFCDEIDEVRFRIKNLDFFPKINPNFWGLVNA